MLDNTHQTRGPSRTLRARAVALWMRDTGLGLLGFAVVLVVAFLGWTVSFIGLHTFAMQHMALTWGQGWFVPGTFDGAAAGLSIVIMRAGVNGRPATLWRVLLLVFTALSSWINWVHLADPAGRFVASVMPPSAVILFEGIMSEVRAAAKERHGDRAPLRVHPARWIFDRTGTLDLYRRYILGLPLPEVMAAPQTPTPGASSTANSATAATASGANSASLPGASNTASERQDHPEAGATSPRAPGANGPRQQATTPRQRTPRSAAKKAARSGRRSMDEWVELARPIFQAELHRLRRQPTANEFAAAIKGARLGTISDSTAKNIRTEILDRADIPALTEEGM